MIALPDGTFLPGQDYLDPSLFTCHLSLSLSALYARPTPLLVPVGMCPDWRLLRQLTEETDLERHTSWSRLGESGRTAFFKKKGECDVRRTHG